MISLIVAYDKNFNIGKDNKLLWHLKDDMKNFKEVTKGKVVIMGRKTFESIGKPLPGRTNIIISRNENFKFPGIEVINSLEKAVVKYQDCVIIGGAQIYSQALSFVDRMYVTEVECKINGDAKFPKYDLTKFTEIYSKKYSKDENNDFNFTIKILNKN